MEIIDGVHFEDEFVEIDGKQFVDCTFDNCILKYGGGNVSFERTTMSGCRHVFYGRARSTLHYLQGVGLMHQAPTAWGEYSEQVQ